MQQLPSEIQLLIIDYLGALDIIRLQLTCKHYHRLIEKSAQHVWKNCLLQQCIEEELFWPSFKDLSLASEFKEACTTSTRVIKAYEKAREQPDAALKCIELGVLMFPEGFDGDEVDNIQEVYLIPGGRFLLTVHHSRWLCVWDLVRSGPDIQVGLKLLLRYGIDEYESLKFIDAVLDTNKVRLLARVRSEIPPGMSSLIDLTDEEVVGYEYLQLTMSDDTWSIQRLGRLTVIYPDLESSEVNCSNFDEDKMIFHGTSETLVWDFVQNQYSMWQLEGVSKIYDVFSFGAYMHYLTLEGIVGVEGPPGFRPIECDCIVVPSSSDPDTLTLSPAFSIPHQRQHENVDRVVGPGSCNNRLRGFAPVIYEIMETSETTPDNRVTTIYRYRFQFNPNNPAESQLDLIESSILHKPPLQPDSLDTGHRSTRAPVRPGHPFDPSLSPHNHTHS